MSASLLDDCCDAQPFDTLTAALEKRAQSTPERIAYRFLRDGQVETETISYGELRQRSLGIARRLSALGARGERALLVFAPGLQFLSALFGCMYAGVVAVPVNAPNKKRGIDLVKRIAADAQAHLLVSTGDLIADWETAGGVGALQGFDCNASLPDAGIPWHPPEIRADDLALLQYTSGTTSAPRGVLVTHANFVDNHRQITACLAADADAKCVSWLPMFHDMGLGIALQAVCAGVEVILLPPRSLVQNPLHWLSAIARYRATISGGPDFAFDLCVRRIALADRARLDLSSWRVAFNGSEPLSAACLQRFAAAFVESGFRFDAFQPVYGLAEGTLLVSSDAPNAMPFVGHFDRDALGRGRALPAPESLGRPLVSCGRAWPGTSLAIVDPETRQERPAGQVGEVWIRGPGVASGYFGRGRESAETFGVSTANGDGGYLRSGDLGFMHEGRLFVVGRRQDRVIRGDITHYPNDIEATASSSHPALAPHAAAAFTFGTNDELVLVSEVRRNALRKLDVGEVLTSIRRAVRTEHGLEVEAIDLLQPGTLLRTTSGKVRRGQLCSDFREGRLVTVASWRAGGYGLPLRHAGSAVHELPPPCERAKRLLDWLRAEGTELLSTYETGASACMNEPLRVLSKTGAVGMQVGTEYGGQGLSQLDAVRVLEQLGALDFKAAIACAVNDHLGVLPIARHGSGLLKSWLLPGLLHAEEFAGFASFDVDGRPPAGASGMADDSFLLTGTKLLDAVVNAPALVNVFVTDSASETHAFVVAGRELSFEPIEDKLGGRALGFARGIAVLEGVRVAASHALGAPGAGASIQRECSMQLRLGLAAACVGGVRHCAQAISSAAPYAAIHSLRRTPNPLTLSRLGAIKARMTALGCLVESIAHALDSGCSVPAEAFVACSLLGPELLLRSTEDLLKLGIPLEQGDRERALGFYRDAGALQNHDGPGESLAEATGASVMGGDATELAKLIALFGATAQPVNIEHMLETVRARATKLNGTLAPRAQRWVHTRTGELTSWLLLVAALEGAQRSTQRPELRHAHAWAQAQFESALAAVRFGTPSEAAAIDSAEAAATFGALAQGIIP